MRMVGGRPVPSGTPNGQDGANTPLKTLDPLSWADKPIPERKWIVPGIVPRHNVTMLAGDGGLGKTLLCQQLATSCATARPWLGIGVAACKTLLVCCEDDADELHRRQYDINRSLDIDFGDLENMLFVPRAGLDNNAIMEWPDHYKPGEETWLNINVMNKALDFGAEVIFFDSLHDVFPGNEINRQHARQFIGSLRRLAMEIEGAVILTAHPSLSGRNTGTGESGSTGWNNAVRSRLYLTRPAEEEGPEDTSRRVLKTMKNNYGPDGGEIPLIWKDGVFAPESDQGGIIGTIQGNIAERVFMDLLDRTNAAGRHVSHSSNAGNYAPRVFSRSPDKQGVRTKDFIRAMESLFSQGSIRVSEDRKHRGIIRDTSAMIPNGETTSFNGEIVAEQ